MKTPREILLQKHESATPRLDAVREQTVAGLSEPQRPARGLDWVAALRQVFTLPRPARVGLAAAWVVILALHVATSDRTKQQPATMAKLTPVSRQALAEQRRLYVEMVRSGLPADVPEFVPRPRSHCRPNIAAA